MEGVMKCLDYGEASPPAITDEGVTSGTMKIKTSILGLFL